MGQIDNMEAKLDWCVAALKALLASEAGVESEWEYEAPLDEYPVEAVPDYIVPIHAPKPVEPPACSHNHQVLVDGIVRCAKCGFGLTRSGVRGRDATSPVPAPGYEEQFNHISSKNPGGALVPN